MLREQSLMLGTICLMVWTTQWAAVISASISSEEMTPTVEMLPDDDLRAMRQSKNDLFSSEEIDLDDYEDDLDADFRMQRKHFSKQANHEWDVLIFTQQWPVTSCYHWREENKDHTCALPVKKERWTIHGIWPTKLGHMGPSFCNNSAYFNMTKLEQIEEPLYEYWPTIEGGAQNHSDILWKHEWLKHGTCAMLIKELDDELKYFQQGLFWRHDFLLTDILASSGIHPDSNNTVIALHRALVKVLGKNPSIHCIYDNKKEISYLLEIRICFDKTLQLTDCDGVRLGDAVSVDYPGGTVNTNCHISSPVYYPSNVPPLQRKNEAEWKFPVVNVYKLLQFIMWFTL